MYGSGDVGEARSKAIINCPRGITEFSGVGITTSLLSFLQEGKYSNCKRSWK
jgi:hypothetical protein